MSQSSTFAMETQDSLPDKKTGHLIVPLEITTSIKKKKRNYQLVIFSIPANWRMKIKENQNKVFESG